MANCCCFTILLKGDRINCMSFLQKLNSCEEENHFFGTHGTLGDEYYTSGSYRMVIYGECRWSLESCCREGSPAHTDLFAVNTRDLNLVLEAYSDEDGFDFQEHYIYDNGECKACECVDKDQGGFGEMYEYWHIEEECI